MSLATDLIGGSLTDGIAKIIGLFKIDPTKAMENQTHILEIQEAMQGKILDAVTAEAQAQIKVNEAEAANPNLFVSGWRPAIGWVCGLALFSQFIVAPMFTWGYSIYAAAQGIHATVVYPTLDMGTLLTLLLGMLGLSGMRTYEKTNGVADTHVKD